MDQSQDFTTTDSQVGDPNLPSYRRGEEDQTIGTLEGDDSLEEALKAGNRHLRASSPNLKKGTKFQPGESPFERLKNEVESEFGGDMSQVSQVESLIDRNRREREREMREGGLNYGNDNENGNGKGKERGYDQNDDSISGFDSPPQISAPKSNRNGNQSPKKLLNKVLTSESRKQASKIVGTTPKGPIRVDRNPFNRDSENSKNPSPIKWNGIADLRKTPLNSKSKSKKVTGSPIKKGEWSDSDDEEGSLALPPGMSPPITMQFSIPRSKYLKTPAKEAAKLVVEDLLRTVGGTSPVLRERERKEKELRMSVRKEIHGGRSKESLINTPLKKSNKERVREIRNENGNGGANRRRDSMPTPPSITRHISIQELDESNDSIDNGNGGKKLGPRDSTTPVVTPALSRQDKGSVMGSATGSTASKLMDQDEDGELDGEEDDDDEVPENLGTKLSQISLGSLGNSADGIDRMLKYGNVSI